MPTHSNGQGRPSSWYIHQGTQAEYMVAVDLMKQGYTCFLAGCGLRYDLVLDIDGKLYRVQVKSTYARKRLNEAVRSPTYLFRLNASPGSQRLRRAVYTAADFDILALVVMETGEVAYLDSSHATKKTIQLKPAGFPKHARRKTTYNVDELPLSAVLKELKSA